MLTSGAAQVGERLRAAEANTKKARSEGQASESELDRQARETVEQAKAAVTMDGANRDIGWHILDRRTAPADELQPSLHQIRS